MSKIVMNRHVFTEAGPKSPAVLGGKGAGLVEMATVGVPVPPGFTDTTSVARAFAQHGVLPKRVQWQNQWGLAAVEKATGKKFADRVNPLLLSVRSGAAVSMPGMMDTILNLGLNPEIVEGMGRLYGRRFALDCYRRFLSMFGDVVVGVERQHFDHVLDAVKLDCGVNKDSDLDEPALEEVVTSYRQLIVPHVGALTLDDPHAQLSMAMEAVLRSWNSERAREYRRVNRIPNDLGTAINVQAMVFGNRDDNSCTGVVFSSNCVTGEAGLWGEFLINAQGEDVVAGVRTAQPVSEMEKWNARLYAELKRIVEMLAQTRNQVVDVEFTVEAGKLYILQVRKAKLTAVAAVTVAVRGVWTKAFDKATALKSVGAEAIEQVKAQGFQPEALSAAVASRRLLGRGLAASAGVAVGRVVCSSQEAVKAKARGEQVVLVRPDTSPDDLKGMLASVAIVTYTGGATSHAAVVARGMGKPCVVACQASRMVAGMLVSVDGQSGVVVEGEVPRVEVQRTKEVNLFLRWLEAEKHGYFPKPRLAFEMFEQSVPVDRLINDFYLTDAMARLAVGSVLERDAKALRTKVHTEVAERVAMYLAVAVGGEIRHAKRMWMTQPVREVMDELELEFMIRLGGPRGAAQLQSIDQLKRMSQPDHVRFADHTTVVFNGGGFSGGYGGPKWGAIAAALHGFLTGELSHAVFADHAFDLQHNSGSVFGKHAMISGSGYGVASMLECKKHARTLSELKSQLGSYSSDMSQAVCDLLKRGEQLGVWRKAEARKS